MVEGLSAAVAEAVIRFFMNMLTTGLLDALLTLLGVGASA